MTRREWAWASYDFANSAFPTVVSTFVIATYFVSAVAPNPVAGQAAWGWMQAAVGLTIGVLSPVLGAVADAGGRRRGMLMVLTLLTATLTASLWFVEADPGVMLPALLLLGAASVGFELGSVFYNAMLPGVARPEAMGRVSGVGWAVGYAGGLLCLGLCLWLVRANPLGRDVAAKEPVRATAVLVGLWLAVFCWPVLIVVPDPVARPPVAQAVREGLAELTAVLRALPGQPVLGRFLLARIFYTDGLNTLFAFGAIYAAGRFGMGFEEILLFGILLNVTAGVGALVGGLVEDRLGSRRTVLIALGCIIGIGVGLLLVQGKTGFWVLGAALGLFFGPAQAASRTLMARLAPPGEVGAWFGLFSLSGRVTGFLGPALLALATGAFASQVAGMAVVVALMALGFAVLLTVRAR